MYHNCRSPPNHDWTKACVFDDAMKGGQLLEKAPWILSVQTVTKRSLGPRLSRRQTTNDHVDFCQLKTAPFKICQSLSNCSSPHNYLLFTNKISNCACMYMIVHVQNIACSIVIQQFSWGSKLYKTLHAPVNTAACRLTAADSQCWHQQRRQRHRRTK